MTEQAFDRVGDAFVSYYDEVRGYVREQLTRRNLAPYLGNTAMRVIDIGGGDGRDAIWLARQGHYTQVVDPSEKMITKAKEAVEAAELSEFIELRCGYPADVLNEIEQQYDVVLSHGVMMYLDDPQSHLNLLERLVKSDGVVSVLTKGKAGSMGRLLQRNDYRGAATLLVTGRLQNNLGEDVLAVDFTDMDARLELAGLRAEARYGVRVATDLDKRPIQEVDNEELERIIAIESRLGGGERTKHLGQMLHFICKRVGDKT